MANQSGNNGNDGNDGWKKKGGTVGGNFRKWDKIGDTIEGIFEGQSSLPSKFGGANTILSFRDRKTDEQFRVRAPAALARMAEAGEFTEGTAYRITHKSVETTAKGFNVKTFDVFEEEPF